MTSPSPTTDILRAARELVVAEEPVAAALAAARYQREVACREWPPPTQCGIEAAFDKAIALSEAQEQSE